MYKFAYYRRILHNVRLFGSERIKKKNAGMIEYVLLKLILKHTNKIVKTH